jgi:hypothetical protein
VALQKTSDKKSLTPDLWVPLPLSPKGLSVTGKRSPLSQEKAPESVR